MDECVFRFVTAWPITELNFGLRVYVAGSVHIYVGLQDHLQTSIGLDFWTRPFLQLRTSRCRRHSLPLVAGSTMINSKNIKFHFFLKKINGNLGKVAF